MVGRAGRVSYAGVRAPTERLIERWSTPAGRRTLQRVLEDLHADAGLNMPALLDELAHTEEVEDGLDLRFAPLESQQLDELNLYACDLTGAMLSGSSMQRTDVRDALLAGANLEGVDLRGAYLSSTDLTGANLKGARLDEAMLDGANLSGASLLGASCQGAFLSGAVLDGADLRRANLGRADLGDTSCRGATVSAGALERCAVPPPDRASIVVESLPPRGPRGRPPSGRARRGPPAADVPGLGPGPSGARRRPASGGRGRPSGSQARPRGGSGRGPRPAGRPGARPARASTNGALRDWDLALARLLPMRGSVHRITIWVDGEERVLFEQG